MIRTSSPALLATVAAALGVLGCSDDRGADRADTAAAAAAQRTGPAASRVATVQGFRTPESVIHDPAQDVYFVSNINGNPSQKSNDGFISRIAADGLRVDTMFIAGGRNQVTLNAPKGMAIRGDTLWVTDIDAVRAFNARTGAPIASVRVQQPPAVFLNDVAAGPDGSLYITDTGLRFSAGGEMSHPGPNRIYRVGARREISVAAEGDTLGGPNGITWDAANGRFIVVPFASQSIFAWSPGDRAPRVIASGPGQFDGVEVLDGGRIIVSSWADSSVHVIANGEVRRLISGVPAPADIGLDARRRRILVPLFMANRVEVWEFR